MLLMNLTKEENLTRVVLQIAAGFASYIFVAMYLSCYVQVSSITVETAEECMNSVQSTANKKNHQNIINIVNSMGKCMNM